MSWKDNFPKEKVYFENDNGILYCSDCLDVLKKFHDESVDLVITDPPYGVLKQEDWDKFEYFVSNLKLWLQECWRVSKKVVLWMCGDKRLPTILKMSEECGINFRRNLVWIKDIGSRFAGSADFNLFYAHENILVFVKRMETADNKQKRFGMSWFNARTESKSTFGHPTTKPLVLMEDLVYYFSNEGELVLDPFLGSGTTAGACERLNRRWIGIEMNEQHCETASNRLKVVGVDFALFGNVYKEERDKNRDIALRIKR